VPARAGRALAIRVLIAGGALAAFVQLALPLEAPLYDGVPILEPYRFTSPAPGDVGSPTSYAADAPISNGRSPQITAATGENPPQAQLIALAGAFTVPSGVATIHISIAPVPPAAPLPKGALSGNVYRISVTDPSGAPLAVAAAQAPTVAMRSAATLTDAAVFRYANGAWQQLDTVSNASLSIYTAQPDALGDFAVVDLGPAGLTTTDLVIIGTVGVVILALAAWAIRAWRRRRALALEAERSRRSRPSGRAPRGPTPRGAPPPKRRR
jgi:hypothetical protein